MNPPAPPDGGRGEETRRFVRFSAAFYLVMAAAGAALAAATGALGWFAPPARPLESFGLAVGCASLAVLGSRGLLATRPGRRLVVLFLRALPPLSAADVALLSAASGIGEEALFRGALLPLVGFPISTLLFAAAHFPVKPAMRVWTLFALVVGAAFGLLTLRAGSALPACLAHALVNAGGFAILAALRGRKRRRARRG